MKTTFCVLTLTTLTGWHAPEALAAEACCERPAITVVGEAEVRVVPDQAVLRLRVVTQNKELLAAKQQNDQNVKATLELARRFGVKPERLQTNALGVEPQWTTPREGARPALIGYEVSKQIVLVLEDFARADELLTEVVKAGVNHVDAFELRTSEPRKYKDQARAMAIRAAREKASALAREIGQSIGKAVAIREEPERTFAAYQNSNSIASSAGDDDGEGSFAAGQASVRARISVTFELQ